MMNLILTLSLFNAAPATQTASIQPCVWPRVCSTTQATVASIQPCVWPRVCTEAAATIASGPVQTCQYPNVCG